MKKLFVFSMGGTGARVMRSLTMLMSAGELDEYEVVPILVEVDMSAGSLSQSLRLMNEYREIHNKIYGDGNFAGNEGFFRSRLSPISSFYPHGMDMGEDSFLMDTRMTMPFHNVRISDLLGYPSLHGDENKFRFLLDSLFTNNQAGELGYDLVRGFKGNAKVARVGFAGLRIQDTIEFKTFLNIVNPAVDRVVIVGATFGATGSVGVIEILKYITSSNLPMLNNLSIATVLVEPYFQLSDPYNEFENQSHSFNGLSQEFYNFYHKLGLADIVSVTYKIRMDGPAIFECNRNDYRGLNPAHPIELLSAMAICEYAHTAMPMGENHLVRNNFNLEREKIGLKEFYSLPGGERVFQSLARFMLSARFFKEHFRNTSADYNRRFLFVLRDRGMTEQSFIDFLDQLGKIFDSSLEWMSELSAELNNRNRLALFDMSAHLSDIVEGYKYLPNRRLSLFYRPNVANDYERRMGKILEYIRQKPEFENMAPELIIVRLFSESSRDIFKEFNEVVLS